MYQSILVPLDGSAVAEHALPTALNLARRFGAALQVVHVKLPFSGLYEEGAWYDATADRELREDSQAYLDGVTERLWNVANIPVSAVLLEGLVVGTINRHAVDTGVDLVIMTTHGRGPLARFWLGSVADALIRQTSVPMLLVRPQEMDVDLTQEPPAFGRVLIPLDGSQLSEQIVEPAVVLAAATQAEVILFRVIQQLTPESYSPDSGRRSGIRPALLNQLQGIDRQERERTEEYLDQLAGRLRVRSLKVLTRAVSHLRPATAILDASSSDGVGLIALATHGRGGLKRLLVGSVADKILRGATTPVLVYRPVGEVALAEEE